MPLEVSGSYGTAGDWTCPQPVRSKARLANEHEYTLALDCIRRPLSAGKPPRIPRSTARHCDWTLCVGHLREKPGGGQRSRLRTDRASGSTVAGSPNGVYTAMVRIGRTQNDATKTSRPQRLQQFRMRDERGWRLNKQQFLQKLRMIDPYTRAAIGSQRHCN
jgi:hypothetical protein